MEPSHCNPKQNDVHRADTSGKAIDKAATPNPGRARDHLANERTYLAWIRTAVSLMGFGVVIAKMKFSHDANSFLADESYLGICFIVIGLLTAAFAPKRFLTAQREIEEATFRPRNGLIIVESSLVGLLGLLIVILALLS